MNEEEKIKEAARISRRIYLGTHPILRENNSKAGRVTDFGRQDNEYEKQICGGCDRQG